MSEPAINDTDVLDILVDWKTRFAQHKSVTLVQSFDSFPTNRRGLLSARTKLLGHLGSHALSAYQARHDFSRRKAFDAFDRAIAEATP